MLSSVCGQYVIFYLFNRNQGTDMEKILQKFDNKDFAKNDELVNAWVNHNFNLDEPVYDVPFIRKQIRQVAKIMAANFSG